MPDEGPEAVSSRGCVCCVFMLRGMSRLHLRGHVRCVRAFVCMLACVCACVRVRVLANAGMCVVGKALLSV